MSQYSFFSLNWISSHTLIIFSLQGIACSTESDGYKHLDAATAQVLGTSVPYSDCGSLPLVGDMEEAGFDIQVCVYH